MDILSKIEEFYMTKDYVEAIIKAEDRIKVVFHNNVWITVEVALLINVYINDIFYYDFDEQDVLAFFSELEESTVAFIKNKVEIIDKTAKRYNQPGVILKTIK